MPQSPLSSYATAVATLSPPGRDGRRRHRFERGERIVVAQELGERRRRTANLHTPDLASARAQPALSDQSGREPSSTCPLVKGRRPLSAHVTHATFEQDVLGA